MPPEVRQKSDFWGLLYVNIKFRAIELDRTQRNIKEAKRVMLYEPSGCPKKSSNPVSGETLLYSRCLPAGRFDA